MKLIAQMFSLMVLVAIFIAPMANAQVVTLPKITSSASLPTNTILATAENQYVSVSASGPGYAKIAKIEILNNGIVIKSCSLANNRYFTSRPNCTAGVVMNKVGVFKLSAQLILDDATIVQGPIYKYTVKENIPFTATSFARLATCKAALSPTQYGMLEASCVGFLPSYITDPVGQIDVKLSNNSILSACSFDTTTRKYGCLPIGLYSEDLLSTKIVFTYAGKTASRFVPVGY